MKVTEPVLKTKGITKAFSGVIVLRNVDFNIYQGEVHALIGENGAGKSTLVKILDGAFSPTYGEIFLEGQKIKISNPLVARKLGIALMHQEPQIFPDLDVTENIFAGHTRDNGDLFINWREKRKIARELLDSLDLNIDEKAPVKGMSVADQQMIEIICALSTNAKIIIMDEPTAVLTLGEVKILFSIIEKLKEQGKAIVFISHRLDEVKIIASRITVLRDGNKVCERMVENTTRDLMVQLMVGRTLNEQITKEETTVGEALLEVKNLTLPGHFKNVSIKVNRGEIVGLAGLVGAGQTEVACSIFGITPPESGKIFIKGKEEKINNPKEAIRKGLAMVPEDRLQTGLLLPLSVKHNMTLPSLGKISKLTWINFKQEDSLVEAYIKRLSIILRNTNQAVAEISGGNQQKIVLSKWLMTQPEIYILDKPTRGIDVGAKAEVYNLINALAKEGKAVLMISSELEEIVRLSDRVYVMFEGIITAVLERKELSEERIMKATSITKKKVVQSS
ncbi:Ribose import ATP-binding protein RbsA [subsurface metagenome]